VISISYFPYEYFSVVTENYFVILLCKAYARWFKYFKLSLIWEDSF